MEGLIANHYTAKASCVLGISIRGLGINNTDGTFTDVTDEQVIIDRNGMGASLGDFDNDGDLDWFVTAILSERVNGVQAFEIGNRLYRNNNGLFEDITAVAGVGDGGWGWGACFADFDNDSNLDIYHTNGWNLVGPPDFSIDQGRYFESNGDGLRFTEKADEIGLFDDDNGRGIVCSDFDNDGDVDIFVTHRDTLNAGTFFQNQGSGNNYLRVKLNGLPPNTEASGARITARTGGTTQMREISIGSNFTSQNPTVQIFGLAASNNVDVLIVEWPDGKETTLSEIDAGQTLVVDHPDL